MSSHSTGASRAGFRRRITAFVACMVFVSGTVTVLLITGMMLVLPDYFVGSVGADLDPALARATVTDTTDLGAGGVIEASPELTAEPRGEEALAVETNEGMNPVTSLLTIGMIAVLGVTAISALAGGLLAGRFVRPLEQMTRAAQGLARGDLHGYALTDRESAHLFGQNEAQGMPRELGDLIEALDDALESLSRTHEQQQRFMANAAHELRRPIAANHAIVDVALKYPDAYSDEELLTALRANNRRAAGLIDALLRLSSIDTDEVAHTEVNLSEIVQRCIAEARMSLAHVKSGAPEVSFDGDEEVMVLGDPGLLRIAIDNMLTNALRHNVVEGWVRVRLTQVNDHAHLEIENSGPRVAPTEAGRLTEPLFRAQGGNLSGHGIGLSLVLT